MPHLKKLSLAVSLATLLGLAPCISQAAQTVQAARQEGSVWSAIALNPHLSAFEISVRVEDNGTAFLEGRVEEPVQRELAERIASAVPGIVRVDNQLSIDPRLAEQPKPRQAFAQRVEDETLTATVKSKLLWNASTQALSISVETADGVVTLKGQAQTADAKQLAGTLAKNTQGVYEVNNLISLGISETSSTTAERPGDKPQEALADAWITEKVKASLVLSRNLDGLSIDVETRNGMVNLKGTVVSSEQKTHAVEVARNVRGVRGVDADLINVSKSALQ